MSSEPNSTIQRIAFVESICERLIEDYDESTHKFRIYYDIDNCGEKTILETESHLIAFATLMQEIANIMQVLLENE